MADIQHSFDEVCGHCARQYGEHYIVNGQALCGVFKPSGLIVEDDSFAGRVKKLAKIKGIKQKELTDNKTNAGHAYVRRVLAKNSIPSIMFIHKCAAVLEVPVRVLLAGLEDLEANERGSENVIELSFPD